MELQKKIKYIILSCSLITISIISYLNFELIQKVYIRLFKRSAIIEHFNNKGQRDGEFLSYLNGRVYVKADFVNGLREGWVIRYYKNGEIQNKAFYKDNKRNGEEYGYYEDGKLNYESHWENDKYYGNGWNWKKDGKLFVYNATDISDLFYYSEFDSLGRPTKIIGNMFSPNIYSIDTQNDSTIILYNDGIYKKINNLYITVATPPKLITQIKVSINSKHFSFSKFLNNTIVVGNAFSSNGVYKIDIYGSLLTSKGKAVKLDTLNMIIKRE